MRQNNVNIIVTEKHREPSVVTLAFSNKSREYEVKVEEIKREYQARVRVYRKKIEELQAKAKELANSSAKEAYDRGYKDGYQKGFQDGKHEGFRLGLAKCGKRV